MTATEHRTAKQATLFVRDLSGSPIGRAAPLAAALRPFLRVQVLGRIPHNREIYAPYRDVLPIQTVPGRSADPRLLLRLARAATGDVLMACKPLPATLLPAFLAQRMDPSRPIILDVEDDEWSEVTVDPGPGMRRTLARMLDVHALSAQLLHPLTRRVDAVTVATRMLQRRYGGTLIRHGPDEVVFDPDRRALGDRAGLRTRFGLPQGRRLALFAGVPRRHKGWETLLTALESETAADWDLVGLGTYGQRLHEEARGRLTDRFHLLPAMTNPSLPELLSAVDAVPLPQLSGAYAQAQLPAKLLEALAMRVPVAASRVGDLPEILGYGERGWLYEAGDAAGLASALAHIAREPAEAARRAAAGRVWFVAEASTTANRPRLAAVVGEAVAARDRRQHGQR